MRYSTLGVTVLQDEQPVLQRSTNQMAIYAGIDEAGLGPTLGPFVLGTTAFEVPGPLDVTSPETFDFYSVLKAVVAAEAPRGSGLIVVADSKKLFSSSGTLRRLEEALFAFLLAQTPNRSLPIDLDVLLGDLVALRDDRWDAYPWYPFGTHVGMPASLALPQNASIERIRKSAAALGRALDGVGVRVVRCDAVVMPVEAFNRSLADTGNKADTAFGAVSQTLSQLWEVHAGAGLTVRVDKQGNRNQYGALLSRTIPNGRVEVLYESAAESRYFVEQATKRMVVCFATRADAVHLPVSLASIVAKYVRELLMQAQNNWFTAHVPDLRATKGYPQDAARWLAQSAKARERLQVEDRLLIRNR